jgi:hypothetical protein
MIDWSNVTESVHPSAIFEKDGKWWFYDETWSDSHGPFATEALATEALNDYVLYLNQ